jgi:uncharacterized protein (DUF1499 family)
MTLHAFGRGFVVVVLGLALNPGRAEPSLGGPLPPCPATPNCVSSEADPCDAVHHVPPLPLPPGLDPVAALDAFEALVRSRPRATVLSRSPLRLHAIDRTLVFRFVDDVDVRVDPATRLLPLRSASRVGAGDAGTNRRRAVAWLGAQARAWDVAWAETR